MMSDADATLNSATSIDFIIQQCSCLRRQREVELSDMELMDPKKSFVEGRSSLLY